MREYSRIRRGNLTDSVKKWFSVVTGCAKAKHIPFWFVVLTLKQLVLLYQSSDVSAKCPPCFWHSCFYIVSFVIGTSVHRWR